MISISLKKLDLNGQRKVAKDDNDGDDQYLPDTDQDSTAGDGSDMHISPALRALMAKLIFFSWGLIERLSDYLQSLQSR